jgi:alkanesulfonate monooxygenase SsuD/methylene tetrahydromethanopterin reductase-like flavin-dependent oxidoreductase (luciferase family)
MSHDIARCGEARCSIGLVIPSTLDCVGPGASELRDVAAFAAREALDALCVADHLLWPTTVLDPTVALVAPSMVTRRVRLGTAVLQLPWRRPRDVTEACASISRLSRGQIIPGIGVHVARIPFVVR